MNKPLFNFNTVYRTKQTLFTAVWNGLAKQGFKRSVNKCTGSCLYAGPGKTACAVGVLLPRDVARCLDKMSSIRIVHLIADNIVRASAPKTRLLNACQFAHDSGITPAEMQEELRKVAKQFGLTVPGEGKK